jgi:hypothetical protein
MFRGIVFIALLLASVHSFAQASDFISVKKKNNRTVKTFFPGLPISFETFDKRQVSGLITAIRNDSIFVKQWDIRPMLNSLGIPVTDTLGAYLNGFHYKELNKVSVSNKMKLQQLTPGRILIIGGTGYALLNVINGAYLNESVTSKKNLTSLGIAAGAVGTGVLINYLVKRGNRYHIEYVRMNTVQQPRKPF